MRKSIFIPVILSLLFLTIFLSGRKDQAPDASVNPETDPRTESRRAPTISPSASGNPILRKSDGILATTPESSAFIKTLSNLSVASDQKTHIGSVHHNVQSNKDQNRGSVAHNPYATWETAEVNTDSHCTFSARLPTDTRLIDLKPGTIFEVEKRMQAGAKANDFMAYDGKLLGYGGAFYADQWEDYQKNPIGIPRAFWHTDHDAESIQCRVLPRGTNVEARDLKIKRRLVLTAIQQPIDRYGETMPLSSGLVFAFDNDAGLQTISCSTPPRQDATALTISDFNHVFGDRFEVCAPAAK